MPERPMDQQLAMMKGENEGGYKKWPTWPRLALKRMWNGQLELAFLVAGEGPLLGLGNIFMGATEVKQYQDFEAIYDDGWRVD